MKWDFRKTLRDVSPFALLMAFAVWFCRDIVLLRRVLVHPDIFTYYYPLRHWFTQRLLNGQFTLWNPFWGIGAPLEAWTTIPMDIYTLLEAVWGPQYPIYQLIQLLLLLVVVWRVLCGFRILSVVAAAGAILFFMSPWVTYFFFYFLLCNSFIGNALLFYASYKFFETRTTKYLLFISLTYFLSMFGTKIEFWFSNAVANVFYITVLALLNVRRDGWTKSVKLYWGAMLAVLLGILTHAWQINIMVQIMGFADRIIPHGLHNLFSSEMYKKLLLSIVQPGYLWVMVFAVLAWMGLGLIQKSTIHRLRGSPFAFFIFRHAHVFLLFLPLAYYWLRTGVGNLGEITVIRSSPVLFRALLLFLVYLGCFQFGKRKVIRLAYLTVLFIFFMRSQGQVLLVYLTGLQWIPTRDSYIIDFALALIGTFGLARLDLWATCVLGSKYRGWVALACVALVVAFYAKDPYQVHPLMEKAPGGYPFYNGRSSIRDTLHSLRISDTSRIMLINADGSKGATYGWGESLLEGLGSVTEYSSVPPKIFKDWTIYKRFGIQPDSHWGGYTGAYTPRMISLLPKTNTFGFDDGTIYFYSVRSVPPLRTSEMKLLGVSSIVKMFPTFGNERVIPLETIDRDIGMMKLGDSSREPNGIEIWKLKQPLPRAFIVQGLQSTNFQEFQTSPDASVPDDDSGILIGNNLYPIVPAKVDVYQPDRVEVTVQSASEGYLVLTDLYHPFWHVKVDGASVAMFPALSIFRAVKVPKGKHQVEFYAEVPGMWIGLCVSLLSVLLIVLLAMNATKQEKMTLSHAHS